MATARQAYKSLIRSSRLAFANDVEAFKAAYSRIRNEFVASREAVSDRAAIEKKLKTATQVAHILKHNIVQAELKQANVYKLKIDPDRHELGDNMSRFKNKLTPDPCGCTGCVDTK